MTGTDLLQSPLLVSTPSLLISHPSPPPGAFPFQNKAGGVLIIAFQSWLISSGQLVRSNSIPVKQCPYTLSSLLRFHHASLSIFSDLLSGGNISLHNCRLSLPDSNCGISTDAGNVLPATPPEPDKPVSASAADALEQKLITV